MHIKKHGKGYQVQIVRKQGSIYKTFKTRTEAKEWGIKTEAKLLNADPISKSRVPFGDVLQRYADEVSPQKRGHRWESIRIRALLQAPMANLSISKIDEEILTDWINSRLKRVKPGTVIRECKLLRSVFETARKVWRYIDTNPFADVKKPNAPPPRDRRISKEEMETLLSALTQDPSLISGRVGLAFEFAIETAMRAGEICGIKSHHVYDSYVVLPKTKNGTVRKVPLSKRAKAILVMLVNDPDVFSLKTSQIDSLFRKAKKALNIHDLHFHDSRHEAVTRLARKLDVLDLARMIGHNDLKSLRVYYNATPEEIASRLD